MSAVSVSTTQLKADIASAGLGVNQTWQDVTASRIAGTTYTNSTGKPIMIIAGSPSNAGGSVYFYVNAVLVASAGCNVNAVGVNLADTFIIPNLHTYRVDVVSTVITVWSELR